MVGVSGSLYRLVATFEVMSTGRSIHCSNKLRSNHSSLDKILFLFFTMSALLASILACIRSLSLSSVVASSRDICPAFAVSRL